MISVRCNHSNETRKSGYGRSILPTVTARRARIPRTGLGVRLWLWASKIREISSILAERNKRRQGEKKEHVAADLIYPGHKEFFVGPSGQLNLPRTGNEIKRRDATGAVVSRLRIIRPFPWDAGENVSSRFSAFSARKNSRLHEKT